MKNILYLIIGASFMGCGSTQIEQTKEINPEINPEGVKGVVVESPAIYEALNSENTVTSMSNDFTSVDEISEIMLFLTSDDLQGRDTGSQGIATAANYIVDIFKKNGIKPYFESYRDTLSNFEKGTAYNVVGVIEGTDSLLKNEMVIVGAHYDHIGLIAEQNGDKIANGANDNASGTTTVLQLAKYFGQEKANKRTMLFTLFSGEEKGLLGSKHLAKKLKGKDIDLYAMLNFEMVGVPMVEKDHSLYLTGYELSNLADISNKYAGKNLVGFLPKAKEFNLFRRSDNAPFHDEFAVPSQTYSSFDFTNFGHYHKVGDEADEMDFEFMARIVNDVIPMVEGIVNSNKKEVKYK